MIRKFAETAIVLGLLVTLPGSLAAQEQGDSRGNQTDAETQSASSDESGGADETDAEETSGKSKDGDESKGGDESKADDDTSDSPQTGPGGKELREDYPGTEESKQKQMETDRIEGLEFEEGEAPSEAYDVEIQELETKIDDLKEEVFQSKSRIVLLKETVLGGNLSGSRGTVVHHNDLGARFRLKRALYSLDGSQVFDEVNKDGSLGEEKFQIYDGSVSPGNHNVSVLLEYEGGGFGLFNYMKSYQFKVRSSCQFKAEEGEAVTLRVRAVATGGAFNNIEDQPGIRCEVETSELSEEEVSEVDGGETEDGESAAGSGSEGGGG